MSDDTIDDRDEALDDLDDDYEDYDDEIAPEGNRDSSGSGVG